MRYLFTILLTTLFVCQVQSQIVINEIIPPNVVEIKNLGAAMVPIQAYNLCDFPQYDELQNLTVVCGSLNLAAGAIVTVQTSSINIDPSDSELGLYLNDNNFGSAANIVDYVEWGSSGHVRSSVAQAAGQWSAGDFVPDWSSCASLEYDGAGNSSSDWFPQDNPTSGCVENSLDGCGGGGCDITSTGLASVTCDDNGTGTDPGDDVITFTLDPQGTGLGASYNVSVSSGSVNPTSAAYGSATSFSLQAGSAGGGNVVVTVTDVDDTGCTASATIVDPGTCSNDCELSTSGLANVMCNDGGTSADPGDDFISFSLNPDGSNLGATYNVSVSAGSVNPTSASYGAATGFTLQAGSAGGGDVTLTITDAADPNCQIMQNIADPGSCSSSCDLTDGGLSNVQCDDNGTPSDDTDDVISFSLDPVGTNLAPGYSVVVSQGSVNPTSANYGSPVAFTLQPGSAGGGNVTVTIIDDDDVNCTIDVMINDPGTCSDVCDITSAGLSSLTCDENGTPADPGDDIIMFDLNPSGNNLAASYSVTVSSGSINPPGANYGMSTTFSLQAGSAGGGAVIVTITDDADGQCTFDVNIADPGPCSGQCSLMSAGLAMVECDDNGTSTDASDDIITFSLDPTGTNLSGGYSISVNTGSVDPAIANYGAPTAITMQPGSAGGGDVMVMITDNADTTCTIDVLVTDPGSCSDGCIITDLNLSSVMCNDNGTPVDPSDDFIQFTLTPEGQNTSANYNIGSVPVGVSPAGGSYGQPTVFSMPAGSAGGGDVSITVSDPSDPNCVADTVVADPEVCSGCDADGGTINAIGSTTLCLSDTLPDMIDASLGGATGTMTQWAITDMDGIILSLPAGPPFDFQAAGAGICFIWHVAYEPGVTGLDIGNDIMSLTGCHDLSNPIIVTRLEPAGGVISTSDTTELCVDDGITDSINVELMNASGANSVFLVTDLNGLIRDVTSSGQFDFEGSQAPDTCLVWHLAYEDGLTGLASGNNLADLDGCYDMSNSIQIIKQSGCAPSCDVDAGIIFTSSDTTICVGEGTVDTVVVCVAASSGPMAHIVITDENENILDVVPSASEVPLTFEDAGAGTCFIYHIVYEPGLMGLAAGNLLDDLEGCYALSSRIMVNKLEGDDCMTATNDLLPGHLVTLYPNPTSGVVRVTSDELVIMRLDLIDTQGRSRVLLDHLAQGDEIHVSVGQPGMYYLRILTNRGVALKRLVVQQR